VGYRQLTRGLEGAGRRADNESVIKRLLTRARGQAGFGLIELIVALMILNVALLAIVGAFTASAVSLARASRVSTATALANSHLELFRSLDYDEIELNTNDVNTATDATYRSEAGWSTQVTDSTCAVASPWWCDASREAPGADGRQYRIDTYVQTQTATGGRPVKRVTVVIRDPQALSARPFARVASTFDASFQ
jgi:type II secretory pathway pseudopilin PulG